MVDMTVLPVLDNFLRSCIRERDVSESSPLVGSSRKIKDGLVISSTPMDVLFRSPPEIPLIIVLPIRVSAQFIMPSSVSKEITLFYLSSSLVCILKLATKVNASLGVNVAKSTSSCYTYEIR